MSNSYTDVEIYSQLLNNDERMICYVFYEHFRTMLRFNAMKAAGNKEVELDDLIQELYLYMSQNDWEKLRKYSPEYPFANWFSVVSYRFFKDFTFSMIESSQNVPIDNIDDRTVLSQGNNISSSIIMDIKNAIRKAKPPRDRRILEALILNEEEPTDVAAQFEVTVDNLYNIKRRAIAKLIKNHLQDYLNR